MQQVSYKSKRDADGEIKKIRKEMIELKEQLRKMKRENEAELQEAADKFNNSQKEVEKWKQKFKTEAIRNKNSLASLKKLSLIHICRCRRIERCRSRWSPYH
eukprot:TRINITY_DN13879_c0_g1_i1.p2 TRINITY_DN13879_c0_g1~~TRINITY_DN13879_c0_g1_i1.p2  ORF type:complete len:102 (-),score=31.86 TRINITY_DN13879_c0_g1_i1:9-314(-)